MSTTLKFLPALLSGGDSAQGAARGDAQAAGRGCPRRRARARQGLLRRPTRIGRESSNALATEYGRNFVLGVPIDNVDRILRAAAALGVEDLRAVARTYLGGENYVYAAVRGSSTAK